MVLELCSWKRLRSLACKMRVPARSSPKTGRSQAHESCERCCCLTEVTAEIKASRSRAGTGCTHCKKDLFYFWMVRAVWFSHLSSLTRMLRRNGNDDSLIMGEMLQGWLLGECSKSVFAISMKEWNLHFIPPICVPNECEQLLQKQSLSAFSLAEVIPYLLPV